MIRPVLIAAFSVLLASCGEASVSGSTNDLDAPIPARFKGDVTTTVMFTSDYQRECMKAGLVQTGRINGCSVVQGDRKTIIVQNPCKRRGEYARLLCHELAHLQGWSADHEK